MLASASATEAPAAPRTRPFPYGLLVVSLLLTLGVTAWAVSFPGVPIRSVGVIGSLCLADVVLALILLHRSTPRRAPLVMLTVEVAGAVIMVTAGSAAPRLLRFELSRPAFERVVTGQRPLDGSSFHDRTWTDPYNPDLPPIVEHDTFVPYAGSCPSRIGSYAIAECRSFEGGVLFLQTQNAVTDDSGIAWVPGTLPVARADGSGMDAREFTHLGGPWYRWTCGC